MPKAELLEAYARLVVRIGVNLQHDQILVINSPIECASFARLLAKEAYAAGAHEVVMSWGDELSARIKYDMAPTAVFSEFPEWRRAFYTDYAEQGAAFISIAARDPEIFAGVASERLALAQQAAGAALLEYRARLMANQNTWCVASVPTAAWAKKVFPGVSEEAAIAKLWEAIFQTVRIGEDVDVVAAWKSHVDFLHRAAAFLNENDFASLHYTNEVGTDLTIELPEGHVWAGGSELAATHVPFVANLPTEEVYTLPKSDGVHGKVVATKPLVYQGSLIEGFWLKFEQGRVVDFHADKGEDVLRELLATDEGSSRLGEVALVPYDSPISKSGLLFYNTLFDENAACHLALGKAYPTCLKGGEDMQSVELLQHGVNDSLLHEDFMVGSRALAITGKRRSDGREMPVFQHGNFIEF
ncbi:MAG: aminopeptidase [Selenomonadaceae bacterium]|nr:aminopeptidase [Selenomonadaceae bacterium]